LSKWQTLASQNMRLTDIDVSLVDGQQLWSGVWEDGTDGYYIWYDADQTHFVNKFSELAAQNLRLVSVANYNGLYAGAWSSGTDGYYLWVDSDDAHFLAKVNELAAQNLRLVDFAVTSVNGQRRWCGVWRSGADAYSVWINADWQHFLTKYNDFATQGLRLVGLQFYGGLWAGIWRSGTDAYYLWANANESSFLAKWGALAQQNLGLIDVIATPFGGATESSERSVQEHFGASNATNGGSATTVSKTERAERAVPQMETTVAAQGAGIGGGSIVSAGEADDGLETGFIGEGTCGPSELSACGAAGFGGGSVPLSVVPQESHEGRGTGSGTGNAYLNDASISTNSGVGTGGGVLPKEANRTTVHPVGQGDGGGSVDLGVAVKPSVKEGGAELEGHGVHISRPSEG
jgi:hypothetical protein